MVFPEAWLQEFAPWLERVPAAGVKAHCNYCSSTFAATRAQILKHASCQSHQSVVTAIQRAEDRVREEMDAAKQLPVAAAARGRNSQTNKKKAAATPARRGASRMSSTASANDSPATNVSCRICLYNNRELEKDGAHLVALQCGHIVCSRCIPQVLPEAVAGHCPMCRTVATRVQCRRLFLA
jgi:hypothetical protein